MAIAFENAADGIDDGFFPAEHTSLLVIDLYDFHDALVIVRCGILSQ